MNEGGSGQSQSWDKSSLGIVPVALGCVHVLCRAVPPSMHTAKALTDPYEDKVIVSQQKAALQEER